MGFEFDDGYTILATLIEKDYRGFLELSLADNPELFFDGSQCISQLLELIPKQEEILVLDLYCQGFPYKDLMGLVNLPNLPDNVRDRIIAQRTPQIVC